MGHTYRTEPDPPEEPTESSYQDEEETSTALHSGVWIAVSSLFGVLFLMLVMIQMTRLLPESTAYGSATVASWAVFAGSTLLIVGVIVWGLRRRPPIESEGATE